MIKVLHCADIHLDTPFNCPDKQKSETRRAELRGTFTSMMLYAKTNKIDIMLIAGDLFDMEFVTRETVALVLREFAANPYCRFVISPGNHDPYGEDRVYAKTDFPENVYIFENSQLCYFSFDDVGPDHDSVDVYGYAFTSPTMKFNPFAMKNPKKRLTHSQPFFSREQKRKTSIRSSWDSRKPRLLSSLLTHTLHFVFLISMSLIPMQKAKA